MSGITSPWGETTKRISSSTGLCSRLTAHIRNVADLPVRGPVSRSGSAMASMGGPSPIALSGRLVFGDLGLLGRLDQIGLGDPAGLDAGRHDQPLGILAG